MSTAHLTITDTGTRLDPKALAEYLSLIEGCVVASHALGLEWDGKGDIPEMISKQLREVSPLEWNRYFDIRSTELITIDRISRQSPLEITFICVVSFIAMAVVLSGGKIKWGMDGFEAELPPLGDGIKSLKDALGLGGKVTPSYSIRTITIKLNQEELELLLDQDPTQRNKGGFQNFLIGLQSRVNRNTRELTLSDVDLERIERYKANPKKGGFQSRFKKIFGRHFPNNAEDEDGKTTA